MYKNLKRMISVLGELKELSNTSGDDHVVRASRRFLSRRLKMPATCVYEAIKNLERSGTIKIYKKPCSTHIISFVDNM